MRVALLDDLEANGNRTANLVLSEPGGGAVRGAQALAGLEIVDNDAARSAWVSFGLDRIPALRRSVLPIIRNTLKVFVVVVAALLTLQIQVVHWWKGTNNKAYLVAGD